MKFPLKLRHAVLLALFSCAFATSAQKVIPPTDSFRVFGEVKNPKSFSIADLAAFDKTALENQIIYNHTGEVKDTLHRLSGIPIKRILETIEYVYDKPKDLNELCFVFAASDGYKVVFSWNEIYNTEAGNHFYILTEMDGKPLKELEQRIPFISTADLKSGRRYIKCLAQIEVKRVN